MNKVKIKEKARKLIKDNLWTIWKPTLVIMGINIVLSFIFGYIFPAREIYMSGSTIKYDFGIADIITSLFLGPLNVGLIVYILNFVRGKKFEIKDVFSKLNYVLPIWAVFALVSLFSTIGYILLLIPGVIITLMLSMTTYIMADGETKIMDTLKKSKEMTDGYKGDLLGFYFSFFGWILLCIVTLGIACIYVMPYMSVSMALYYEELKKLKN